MAVKNSQRFAEIERLMGDYFGCHLAPVMGRVQRDLSNRQADEMRAYSNSTAGILRSLATANMPGDDPYATLKITGKWNSKTTEDYLAMCKEAIVGNKDMQRDLAVMAEEWRKAVVTEIGRERYDALSKQLGCDLAYAYIDHRMEQLMIEKMVKDRMPTSSADYIIRKAAQSSLFGLPYELNKSPLAAEIEAKGEAAYKPSRTEKAAGWAAGAGADVVAMGGIGSWATFAKFVGIDMVMNVGMEHLSKKGSSQEVCVEECISKGVFGTGTNVFASFRKQAKVIKNHENSYIKATNSHFKNKIPTSNITFMDWTKQTEQTSFPWNKGTFLDPQRNEATKRTGKYKDVPLIVAPGQEDEYLEVKARLDAEAEKEKKAEPKETPDSSTEEATPSVVQQEETALQTNENGWDGLLQSFGLNGFSDIGKNLGYVLAMLPDVLVGLFTGKTKSLNMDNSLLPLASIVAGMFVKNPILKMLLMGMGGANLLNKAGHEVLGRKQQEGIAPTVSPAASRIQYRQYPDEPLNPRISNPMLQGRCLDSSTEEATPSVVQQEETALQTNENGWDGLLQSFGLNGFSDIGKNLGYVLAMLPDVLVGLFTGKTKSLNMDNSLLPLASIVAGMFVKNPILKMLLMGMGGANLLNKAGHEVLGRKQQEGIAPTVSPAASRIQYRQYPDEPLNPRISNPMLQGRCLVANIDHVPCTIQLPDSVIGAHQSGALPLNTLANAILAKNDQMRQMAAMQYEEQARESVVRPRGIQ